MLLIALIWYSLSRRSWRAGAATYIGLSFFAGGLVATIGGHAGGYFSPFLRWALIIAVIWMLDVITRSIGSWRKDLFSQITPLARGKVMKGLIFSASLILFVAAGEQGNRTIATGQALKSSDGWVFSDELGGFVSPATSDFLEQVAAFEPTVIEEYSGLASALLGPAKEVKVDSVIHALGAQRNEFLAVLELNPRYVVSSSASVEPWFAWNVSTNWWFYRHLYLNYSPAQVDGLPLLIWEHQPQRMHNPQSVECVVDSDSSSLVLGNGEAGLYDVLISYEKTGSDRDIVFVRNNLNRPFSPLGYVPLNPNTTEQRIPVALLEGKNKIDFVTSDSELAVETVNIYSCQAYRFIYDDGEWDNEVFPGLGPQLSVTPVDLTDRTWTRGVANDFTAFFVHLSSVNGEAFVPGRSLIFADGTSRLIEKVERNEVYLNVFLSGGALTPEIHGFPNAFRFSE